MSEQQAPQMIFQTQRIYTKDISFEAPKSPYIFQKDWKPEVKMDLDTTTVQLGEKIHEVTLRLTVTAMIEEEVAFLCEVQQAGIFIIDGLDANQLAHCIHAYCPNILYPFARECVLNLVMKGSFPQVNLAPINFDQLFMNYLQQQAELSQTAATAPEAGN